MVTSHSNEALLLVRRRTTYVSGRRNQKTPLGERRENLHGEEEYKWEKFIHII